MSDKSIKTPTGVVEDVLVHVGKFVLMANFVVLYCDVDRDIPSFLKTFSGDGRAFMDSKKHELCFGSRMKDLGILGLCCGDEDEGDEHTFEASLKKKNGQIQMGEVVPLWVKR
ncbi:hypothetical protein HAX54_006314 [Datura stramonium]|uniref:Uncharacterized protein n=1 Tax=Datura stramonium TaxID=4076 RepID=A0ABS8WXL8_DATST|nr:hypothetical protein [Datura stramonium]